MNRTSKDVNNMTYEDRERMFAKEYLSTRDLMELYGLDLGSASTLMTTIKRRCDRLGKKGKLHIQDYFDYFHLSPDNYRPETSVIMVKSAAERILNDVANCMKNIKSIGDTNEKNQ